MTGFLVNPATFLDPSTVSLQQLLTRGRYLVPDYQRDYRWEEEQVTALWEDILAAHKQAFLANGTQVVVPLPHFFGPIVLQDFGTQADLPFEVMDGQQRLVTLSALISVLRERVGSIADQAEATRWTGLLDQLLGSYSTAATYEPRITLARDNDAYRRLVCESRTQADRDAFLAGLSASQSSVVVRRLSGSLSVLEAHLRRLLSDISTPEAQDLEVMRLSRSVLELSLFLEMRVTQAGVAYEVFESLNARGLELEQADLMKNRLYALADTQGSKPEVTSRWNRLVSAIEGQSMITLTEFLFFHYLVTVKPAKQETLYRNVNEYLSSGGVSVADYADSLASCAEAFQEILDTGSQLSSSATRDVVAMRDVLRNKYAMVLIVAACVRHPFPSAEIVKVIELAHHFVFRRYFVEGLALSKFQSEVVELARQYAKSQRSPSDLADSLRSHSSDANFIRAFKSYEVPSNKLGFYILEMLENHISAQAGTHVHSQSPNQHLEHILPKKPDASWGQVVGDPRFDTHVQRVGNLLILERDINSFIKNKGYQYKKANSDSKDYAHSHLKLPGELGSFEIEGNWDFSSIETRQVHLADAYAGEVWPLA